MRILVVNVNTSPTMTSVIGEAARRCATAGTEIEVLRPYFGPEAVDCNFESYLSAVAVMDRVTAYDGPFDAVVLAGFGEHGRDGIAELIEQPVVEICEASAHVAIATELHVPVVDGVAAAVRLAEAIVGLGLTTSKLGTYAPPEPKKITGWPLSTAMGLQPRPGGPA